jgi:hypothetical protein
MAISETKFIEWFCQEVELFEKQMTQLWFEGSNESDSAKMFNAIYRYWGLFEQLTLWNGSLKKLNSSGNKSNNKDLKNPMNPSQPKCSQGCIDIDYYFKHEVDLMVLSKSWTFREINQTTAIWKNPMNLSQPKCSWLGIDIDGYFSHEVDLMVLSKSWTFREINQTTTIWKIQWIWFNKMFMRMHRYWWLFQQLTVFNGSLKTLNFSRNQSNNNNLKNPMNLIQQKCSWVCIDIDYYFNNWIYLMVLSTSWTFRGTNQPTTIWKIQCIWFNKNIHEDA